MIFIPMLQEEVNNPALKFNLQVQEYHTNILQVLPVSDELQYLDEELAKAFPPHFAL